MRNLCIETKQELGDFGKGDALASPKQPGTNAGSSITIRAGSPPRRQGREVCCQFCPIVADSAQTHGVATGSSLLNS